jgi:hypothetical protein
MIEIPTSLLITNLFDITLFLDDETIKYTIQPATGIEHAVHLSHSFAESQKIEHKVRYVRISRHMIIEN